MPSFLQFSRHCLSISSSFILLIVIATGRSHSAREFAEKACLPNRVKDSYVFGDALHFYSFDGWASRFIVPQLHHPPMKAAL